MRIVMTHGADQRFEIAATIERDWADALRDGLKSVGVANANDLDIKLAFYGDLWRPDRRARPGGWPSLLNRSRPSRSDGLLWRPP